MYKNILINYNEGSHDRKTFLTAYITKLERSKFSDLVMNL